jgi:hypothetical protein
MADILPNTLSEYLGDGTIDMDNDTFKCALLTNTASPLATWAGYADLTNELTTGNGYTAGGATLQNPVWSRTGNKTKFDADDPQWTSFTGTPRWVVIYDDTAAGKPIVSIKDLGGTGVPVVNGTFSIQFHASGIFDSAPSA